MLKSFYEIECERAQKQYLYYEYFRMSKLYPNTWSCECPWCRYFIMGPRGISCRDIFDEAIRDHDFDTGTVFPPIEQALRDIPGISQGFIDTFKKAVTVWRADYVSNIKLAIFSGARVNSYQIVEDLRACANESQATEIFKGVLRQMRAAAMNGIYKKIFSLTELMWWDQEEDRKKIFDMKTRIEQRLQNVIGSAIYTRFIPDDLEVWELPRNIVEYLWKEEENKAKRTETEILLVVNNFEKLLKAEIAKQVGGV